LVQNLEISLQRGSVDPNFRVEVVAPTSYSSSQKTRLNDLSHGIKIWTEFSSVLSQPWRLTDRQTDRETERILIARPRLHSTQRGKKTKLIRTWQSNVSWYHACCQRL